MQPTTFVQQMNTVSALTHGRVAFNIVAGSSSEEQRGYGDFLSHDERVRTRGRVSRCAMRSGARTATLTSRATLSRRAGKTGDAFCIADQKSPEIYVSGHSEPSEQLAYSQGTLATRGRRSGEARRSRACARARRWSLFQVVSAVQADAQEAIEVLESLLPEDMKESTTSLKDDSQMYQEGSRLATTSLAEPFLMDRACSALRSGMDHATGFAAGTRENVSGVRKNRRHGVHHVGLARSRHRERLRT